MSIPIRPAACFVAVALLCACSAPKPATTGATQAPPAASAVPAPAAPANAPVPAAGRSGAVPLDAAQRADLVRAVAAQPAAVRPRLRYALAAADDGKPQLVVYD